MRSSRSLILLSLTAFSIGLARNQAAEKQGIYTSPSAAVRIESSGSGLWVVSTNDPAERAKLPAESADSFDEFHIAPNDEWIFSLRHVGSGLRNGDLYHRVSSSKVEMLDNKKPFNALAWRNCVTLGVFKRNYSLEGLYAMTYFDGWSLDSTRLLVRLSGGEQKRAMQKGCVYFNTLTKRFELTDYLRKLNETNCEALACAEPGEALPTEKELKVRLEKLDRQLNDAYKERIAKTAEARVAILRESQRQWIKRRDEGVKFYLNSTPAAEKERRRLQFLGDATAARLDDFQRPSDEDL